MERSHGDEGDEGKCRKDKGHDLRYRLGPLTEFRRITMCCLSFFLSLSICCLALPFEHYRQVTLYTPGLTGVGNNSIFCNGCKLWVHKKCSGLQQLTPNPDYRCATCMGNACPIDCRPQSEVQVGPNELEVVDSFCYLGDMLSAG